MSNNILGQANDNGFEIIARRTATTTITSPPTFAASTGNVVRNNPMTGGLPSTAVLVSGVDPKLGSLGSHGDPTQTIPVLPDSPARMSAALVQNVVATDQRGLSRPGTFASQSVFAGAYSPQVSEF